MLGGRGREDRVTRGGGGSRVWARTFTWAPLSMRAGCTHARTAPSRRRFAAYNVLGALVWTVLFVGAGFFFGNLPIVQKNFTLVVLGIIAVSVVPVVLEVLAARREARGGGPIAG